MGKIVEFSDSQRCSYPIVNHWGQPLGRMAEFAKPFELPPLYYVETEGARLTSHRAIGFQGPFHLIDEMYPFHTMGRTMRLKLSALNCRPKSQHLETAVCSLVSPWDWHNSYFHWFLDYLPSLFAAEHYAASSGSPVTVLVPSELKEWQRASLTRLGFGKESLLSFAPTKGFTWLKTGTLVASHCHRRQKLPGIPKDAISPSSVHELKRRLSGSSPNLPQTAKKKIYLSRRDATSRRLINEDEILKILSSHGFEAVALEGLSLEAQINLFSQASHIVAVHGAGLTNLLHAERASVLEIHSENHGIRPDYFQIASINHCNYFHYVADSQEFNDISVPPDIIHTFLEETS